MVETRGRGENGQHETESEDGVLGVIRQRRWVAESREREEVRGHREEDSREGEVRGDYYGGREEFRALAIEDEVGERVRRRRRRGGGVRMCVIACLFFKQIPPRLVFM